MLHEITDVTLPDPLDDAVVVVTGASSGIGRATALQFAARGCRVAVAARRAGALRDVATQCEGLAGEGRALVVPTDVTVERDLTHLVDEVLGAWGRVDVWVNNAGTTLFGRLDEGPWVAHRQVLETNLLAPMFVARLLLPRFRTEGHGTLINVGSVLSQVGQAFVPSYAISKFGLRGLSEALRSEVADVPRIHVCTVLPYAVDTPHFQEGANVIGRRAWAMPPVQSPEDVARAIVDVAARPRRQVYVPWYVPAGLVLHWLWPRPTERLLRHALETFHMVGTERATPGALFEPVRTPPRVHGTRSPRVSVPRFAAWVVGDLVRMGGRWLRGRPVR